MESSKQYKILALILAIIMIGSVLAVFAPSSPKKEVKVKKKLEIHSFKDIMEYTPPDIALFQYVDMERLNGTELGAWVKEKKIVPTSAVEWATSVDFQNGLWVNFFRTLNDTPVTYPSSGTVEYGNYTLKDRNGIVLLDEIIPYVFGPQPVVENVIDLIDGKTNQSAFSAYYQPYNMSIFGDNFDYVQIRVGNLTAYSDLIFVGIKHLQDGNYERVSAFHLTQGNVILVDRGNKSRFLEYNITYSNGYRIKRVVGNFTSVIEDPL